MHLRADHVITLAAGVAGLALAAVTPSPFPLTAMQPVADTAPAPIVVDVEPDVPVPATPDVATRPNARCARFTV